jgi:hypothetical protein
MKCLTKMKLILLALAAATLLLAAPTCANEATIDADGNVITDDEDTTVYAANANDVPLDTTIGRTEALQATIVNNSPYRIDIYWDDGQYGAHVSTLDKGETGQVNTYVGHSFFITRHGVKEGLFYHAGEEGEERIVLNVRRRNQKFLIPSHAAPSTNPCQDRFSICKSQAENGGCHNSPGWMIVHCCQSCDKHLDSKRLIDPKVRCSKEQLNTPEPVWKPGDLNKMFERWASDEDIIQQYGLEVITSPEPKKHNATWENAKDGHPWVVVFNNFLSDNEVDDLIRGGEMEGYERSTDQGAANALGEQEKIVSQTRTSSNAWCMHKCERLGGVRSATTKIEDVTG